MRAGLLVAERALPATPIMGDGHELAGLTLAFEKCQFTDGYIAGQAPINADWLCRVATGLRGPGWANSDPSKKIKAITIAKYRRMRRKPDGRLG